MIYSIPKRKTYIEIVLCFNNKMVSHMVNINITKNKKKFQFFKILLTANHTIFQLN